ncbi:MAG: phosphatase PAP2 family protein [Sphingomonas sp.]|uniref:phosphatase PAP2 family protein n=1 Tax=Sphingomonas sp. TaxID=28214 RepID=UPI001B02E7CB|nr:phosphatase PAP2 family protein [Sphingomonas sp.]MBO9621213.1 phosphatase PAP2 family protein [Sphingomonas sp.]
MSKKKKLPEGAHRASVIERIDVRIAQQVGRLRDAMPVRVAARIAALADQPPLFAASAATLAAGLVLRRPRLARTGARMLASEYAATLIKSALKHRIDRTRPHKMLRDGRYAFREAQGEESDGSWSSFPSGHTAGAVASGRAIARETPAAGPVTAAAAAGVALVQLPDAKHFASDVVAGAAIGWAAEALVEAAARILIAAGRSPD